MFWGPLRPINTFKKGHNMGHYFQGKKEENFQKKKQQIYVSLQTEMFIFIILKQQSKVTPGATKPGQTQGFLELVSLKGVHSND